ncbi:MAG: hypothetical protein KatS3mg065_0484 [Chloroflexota bacterium]|nr:MAG: hypothetical protein KatS3mg065_0484 [Chloroflexota bacterium]
MAACDPVSEPGDPGWQVGRQAEEDLGRHLGVGKGPMAADGEAEEGGQVAELERLRRPGERLPGDDEGVEVAAVLEAEAVAEGGLEEGDVEADVVADDEGVPGEGEEPLGGLPWARGAADVGVGEAVELGSDDGPARVDEGREAVDDLAPPDPDGADLDEVVEGDVGPGRLDVDDDELPTGRHGVDEGEDRAGAGLEVRDPLRLADGPDELLLDVDEGLEGPVTEEDGLGHDVLGDDLRPGLDHHDGVAGARHDEVDLRVLELADRRVDDELAADPADPDGPDGPQEGDLADRQGGRGGDGAEDVGVVLLIRREDGDDDLDVVPVALREEGPDRSVRQPGGEDRSLRGSRFALDEAARDLAGGVHPLLEVDGEGEEVEPRPGVGAVRRPEDDGIAVADGDRAAGEEGHLAGLDGEGPAADGRFECL